MQTRRQSFIETIVGTTIGYFVAIGTQLILFPMLKIEVAATTNLLIGAIFTIVSIVRSYCVRRLFNWIGLRNRGIKE